MIGGEIVFVQGQRPSHGFDRLADPRYPLRLLSGAVRIVRPLSLVPW